MRNERKRTNKPTPRGVKTNLTKRFLYAVFNHFSSGTARGAKSMLLRGQWEELVALSVDPRDYADAASFASDYLLCEIASKVPPSLTGSTPEHLTAVALGKFREGETQCKDTNQRLPFVDSTMFVDLYGHDVREVFCLARDKIDRLLGNFTWDECSPLFGFGPGATTRLNRSRSDLYYKFGPKPDTTLQNLELSGAAVGFTAFSDFSDPVNAWARQLTQAALTSRPNPDPSPVLLREAFNIVAGNKITTVPKNSKTDRTIAIEPCMNMFVQKGIGGVIRRRLARVGIHLDDQSLNQQLALAGSVDGSLATIDLSMASDTVSSRLVERLLPAEWYRAMNMVRSHSGVLPSGELITYQKFSSMGNGFTFELESLLFWALARGVTDYLNLKDRRLGIYGDDIVVPTRAAQLLLEVLSVAGFTPNAKKTFLDGPFRESCGKHYFHGSDVTPFYLRKEISHMQPLFVAVNNLRRWIHRRDGFSLSRDSWKLFQRWFRLIPREWKRFRGPDGYGDSVLIGNFEECWPHKAEYSVEGWVVRSCRMIDLTPSRKCGRVDGPPLLLKSFYRLEKEMLEEGLSSDVLTTRLNSPLYKEGNLLVIKWPCLGYHLS